uniref:Uncharacterized protein n=1 Tax=Anguilla anguilla TaxID=7936 RepID=A0A0E9W4S4_ANGAN
MNGGGGRETLHLTTADTFGSVTNLGALGFRVQTLRHHRECHCRYNRPARYFAPYS